MRVWRCVWLRFGFDAGRVLGVGGLLFVGVHVFSPGDHAMLGDWCVGF